MKSSLFFLVTIIFSSFATAQFSVQSCKDKELKKQFCLTKKENGVQQFNADDLTKVKKLIEQNPELPWMDVLDHDQSLASSLEALTPVIDSSDKNEFEKNLLILKLSTKPDPLLAVDLLKMAFKADPKSTLHLSHPNKQIVDKISSALSDKPKIASGETVHCSDFDKARFDKVMSQKNSCLKNTQVTPNTELLYQVMAEIIACRYYCASSIDVVETARMRSINLGDVCAVKEPCAINFGDASASIGLGELKIKMHGQEQAISWNSKYDLFNQKNDLNFWRDQLFPQINKIDAERKKPSNSTGTLQKN